jgi:glycerophosphoryl diester phosphodiesterase
VRPPADTPRGARSSSAKLSYGSRKSERARLLLILSIGSLLLLLSASPHAEPADTPKRLMPFDIEAHRGGRALRPENTLPAFANALSMGVDTLELDMAITGDGAVVVSHDRGLNPDLARGPDGRYITATIPFIDLTLAQVKAYDVGQIRPGSTYATQFPEQRPLPGTRIPTLSEVFALVRRSGDTHVRLDIETKIDPNHPQESLDPDHFVAIVLALLQREHFDNRVMIESFDWRTLQLVQKHAPQIPTLYLTNQTGRDPTVYPDRASVWTAGYSPGDYGGSVVRAVRAAGGRIWSPYYRDLDASSIAEAHLLGVAVIAWTVNDERAMAHLIDLGADGIISDRPDVLRTVAAAKGIHVPQGVKTATSVTMQ